MVGITLTFYFFQQEKMSHSFSWSYEISRFTNFCNQSKSFEDSQQAFEVHRFDDEHDFLCASFHKTILRKFAFVFRVCSKSLSSFHLLKGTALAPKFQAKTCLSTLYCKYNFQIIIGSEAYTESYRTLNPIHR